MDEFLRAALSLARDGRNEGGIPIGSVLVIDGVIVGRGYNRRVQKNSPILHAEMDCIENAGRLSVTDYMKATLYSTLSPCDMCSGAALLYKIPRIVVGENRTFQGPEDYLCSRGVTLEVIDSKECVRLMREFIRKCPKVWSEDIGETSGQHALGADRAGSAGVRQSVAGTSRTKRLPASRVKDVRRIDAALVSRDPKELQWAATYCEMRISIARRKDHASYWRQRLKGVRTAMSRHERAL